MKQAQHSSKDIERAISLFFAVRGAVRTKLAQGRRLDPYAWLHIETMLYIRDNAGTSMKDLAAYLSITAPSATSLVSALAKDGLVVRRIDRNDRRTTALSLTKKGKTLLAGAVQRGTALLGELFTGLSRAELAAFTRALARIQASAAEC